MIKIQKKKQYNQFRPMIFSRHPTHDVLRLKNKTLPLLPFRSVVRLGSTTDIQDSVTNGGNRIECNTIEAVKNSASKLRMKERFREGEIKTAIWGKPNEFGKATETGLPYLIGQNDKQDTYNGLEYPIVTKSLFGSRGQGNTLIKSKEEFDKWLIGKNLSNYIFEKFYNYNREYRLHVTEEGCFYTCRKMLKSDTPEDKRWFRNDSNSVWIVEENEQFDKPVNWDIIIKESVKALKAVGLDIGAIDLKVQSSKTSKDKIRENPDFIIIEINSAPSFGDITSQKYIEQIPKILKRKYDVTKN